MCSIWCRKRTADAVPQERTAALGLAPAAAAVRIDGVRGHEGTCVRADEQHQFADLLGFAEPLHRDVLQKALDQFRRRLRRSLEYFLLNNQIRKMTKKIPLFRRSVRRILGAPVRWRIGKNRYSFPWELWLSHAAEKLVTRRSLLTGQALAERTQEVC